MDSESEQAITASEIREIVGDVGDTVVSSILRTGASAPEVLQAAQWLRGGGGLEDEAGHAPHGAAKAVYEILQAEEPEEL